ncbi:hypothetical protein B0H17DRAFT_1123979 [Mycena rosella]|uniref:Uncharacterized protein n=1 Tax=Mycena rosella TaxID=1033263 RepID=A0AAD7H3D7_MYCRO|nr:hypothetical protein B0H17DRAFT_1123979 [Mycena rosella]
MSMRRGSGSSKKIALIGSSWQGRISSKPKGNTTLKFASRRAQEKYRAERAVEQQLRMEHLDPEHLEALDAIRDYNTAADFMDDDSDTLNINDVLEGKSTAEISHGGGEFQDAIAAEMKAEHQRKKRTDWRTQRDRTSKRTRGFDSQMDGLVEMYSVWVGKGEPAPVRSCEDPEKGGYLIKVVDAFVGEWIQD